MIARVAGQRVVILAVPFVVLGLLAILRPPEAVAGEARLAGWVVLVSAIAGGLFGVYLWVRGGERVI